MKFDEFVSKAQNDIRAFLPEKFSNAEIEIHECRKLNERYTGMIIRTEESPIAPTINLDYFFKRVNEGEISMAEAVNEMSEITRTEIPSFDVDKITDYKNVKDRLFIRLSNYEANRGILDSVPHEEKENLAITCHVLVDNSEGRMDSFIINNELLNNYGISREELLSDAKENTCRILPVRIEPIEFIFNQYLKDGNIEPEKNEPDIDKMIDRAVGLFGETSLLVVSNNKFQNGAAAILYPDVLDKLSEKLNSDLFILPSSTHEVIAVSENHAPEYHTLEKIIREINYTQVDPRERLSDEVYHYDAGERVLEKAGNYYKRIMDKERTNRMPVSDRDIRSGEKNKDRSPEI